MTRREIVLRPLIVPAALLAAAVALLVATGYLASGWVAAAERDYRQAHAALANAARQYRAASDDQDVYRRYVSRFMELREAGWIGKEERLAWLESLQTINGELHLPTLRYDIEQQRRADLGDLALAERLELRHSPMRLRLGALHEGDLLDLLARLRADNSGLLGVSQCRLERIGSGPDIRAGPRRANIEATCDLHWYTLRLQSEAS